MAPRGYLTHAVLGPAIWIVLLFVFSLLHVLTKPTLLVAAASTIGLAVLAGRPKNGWPRFFWVSRPVLSGLGWLALDLSILGTLLLCFFNSFHPLPAWDADTYHLTLPRLYLANHGFRDVPWSVYAFWPRNIDLLYALPLAIGNHVTAASVHFAFVILTLGVIKRLSASAGTWRAGAIGAALFLANPIVQFESSVAYVDIAFAFFMAAAFAFAIASLDSASHKSFHVLMCGVSSGLLAGVKLTGFVGAGLIGALLVFEGRRRGDRAWLRTAALFLGPVLLLGLPWFLLTWLSTGNPVYPFCWDTFGGPYWNDTLTAHLVAWNSRIGMGRGVSDWLLLPVRVFLDSGNDYRHFDGRLSPIWVGLIPLAGLAAIRQPLVKRCVLVAGGYFVFWAISSQQARLLIPALPILATASAVALFRFVEMIKNATLRRTVWTVVPVVAAALLFSSGGEERTRARRLFSNIGISGASLPEAAVPEIFRIIDTLPENARILFLNTNRGFFCHREFVADSFFEASQINELWFKGRPLPEIVSLLEQERITHVLLFVVDAGIKYPLAVGRLFEDGRYVRPVANLGRERMILYELVPAEAQP